MQGLISRHLEIQILEMQDIQILDTEMPDIQILDTEMQCIQILDTEMQDMEVQDMEIQDMETQDLLVLGLLLVMLLLGTETTYQEREIVFKVIGTRLMGTLIILPVHQTVYKVH